MKYICIVCKDEKSSSQAFWTAKERRTLEVTCGKCRRLQNGS